MVITILLLCVVLLFISAARPAPALLRSPKKRD